MFSVPAPSERGLDTRELVKVGCTGRSTRGRLHASGPYAGRAETIDETAAMVTDRGGIGIAARVDHLVESEVAALAARVQAEQGRVDVLVNDIAEGDVHEWKPFWQLSLERGFGALRQAVHTHVVTSRHFAPLMVAQGHGLIVEIGDGDFLGYRGTLFYDLVKMSVNRLAYAMACELRPHGVTALAVTPGFMRTEAMLDHFGVTEANWREGVKKDRHFAASETPFFVGRAVAALAADPRVARKAGGVFGSWTLGDEYGFTDADGSRPHWGRYFEKEFGRPQGGESPLPYDWRLVETGRGAGAAK